MSLLQSILSSQCSRATHCATRRRRHCFRALLTREVLLGGSVGRSSSLYHKSSVGGRGEGGAPSTTLKNSFIVCSTVLVVKFLF